jgi:hypothetical protein
MGWNELGLEPAIGGILYYVSRENPRNTFEFYFNANWPLINTALERLKEWKSYFLSDILPPRDKNWRWTEQPCRWCQEKKFVCKPDDKSNVSKLSESGALEWAQTIITSYNYDAIKEKVLARWTLN